MGPRVARHARATHGSVDVMVTVSVDLDAPTASLLTSYIDRYDGRLAELYMAGEDGPLSKGELDDLFTLSISLLDGVSW